MKNLSKILLLLSFPLNIASMDHELDQVNESLQKHLNEHLPNTLSDIVLEYADKKSEYYFEDYHYHWKTLINLRAMKGYMGKYKINCITQLKNGNLVAGSDYGYIYYFSPNSCYPTSVIRTSGRDILKIIELEDGKLQLIARYGYTRIGYGYWYKEEKYRDIKAENTMQLPDGSLAYFGYGEIKIHKKARRLAFKKSLQQPTKTRITTQDYTSYQFV